MLSDRETQQVGEILEFLRESHYGKVNSYSYGIVYKDGFRVDVFFRDDKCCQISTNVYSKLETIVTFRVYKECLSYLKSIHKEHGITN